MNTAELTDSPLRGAHTSFDDDEQLHVHGAGCPGGEHFVQFYEKDTFLVESVAAFVGAGLGVGEGAIVIATQEHCAALTDTLQANGFSISEQQRRGQLVLLDARETLSKFMVDGFPDEALFMKSVGDLVVTTRNGRRGLRAFGEMVALLWADGNGEAAIRLEELWNILGQRCRFSLFCAYPINGFANAPDADAFLKICKTHSRVIPSETFTTTTTDDERSRTIAALQQKAASLEAEIAQRKACEEQLRDFLENATQGIHQVGPDGTIMWANKAELDLLGYTAKEFIGHSITEFHADREVIDDILQRLQRGEKLSAYEARLRAKDGSFRFVSITSSARWEEERFLYTRCFTRDITAEKTANATGRLLSAIVESSDDAIVSKSLDGVITSWNKGAERVFGYSAEEVIGKPVTILIPPERLEEEPKILARIRDGERVDHYDTIRRRKDGTLLNISLTISPVRDANGTIVGASKVARDVTDRVRSREVLEQTVAERTSALRDTVAELEAFSYSIAHDMRAPLRSMAGYACFLERDFASTMPKEGQEFLQRISHSAKRLDRLITDVLNYSKISRGDLELEKVDVDGLTREIIDSYSDLHARGATILVQAPLPAVIGNPAALTQCISNLLSNAVKFVAPGVTPRVLMHAEKKADCIRLWVEDNGIGISDEGQKRIFHMFQRLNLPGEFEGTGIGLTIVRKAVERMGGCAGVESKPSVGSKFWLELKPA